MPYTNPYLHEHKNQSLNALKILVVTGYSLNRGYIKRFYEDVLKKNLAVKYYI